MTNAFAARFDALAARKFKRAGLADAAYYTPHTGGPEVECSAAYIDRGLTLQNQFNGSVVQDAITVTAFLAEIGAAPERGARFRFGDEVFTVDSITTKDESRVVCIVKPGV